MLLFVPVITLCCCCTANFTVLLFVAMITACRSCTACCSCYFCDHYEYITVKLFSIVKWVFHLFCNILHIDICSNTLLCSMCSCSITVSTGVAVSLLCSLCGAMQCSCNTHEIVTLSCDPPPRMLRLDIGYRGKLISEVDLCHAYSEI